MAAKRMAPEDRKEQLLCVAIGLAEKHGYNKINRLMIVHAVYKDLGEDVTDGLVNRYFGGRQALRSAVLAAGIERGNLTILAQGLALGDAQARNAPVELRKEASHVVDAWRIALKT